MTYPLITVGLISHNAEETVARALDSVLSQTWPNTEIIVIDDCSQDGTISVIETYIEKYPAIKLARHSDNRGVAYTRQELADIAQGEYIAYFDDDDVSFPARLEKQYERFNAYKQQIQSDKIFCYGDRIVIKNNSQSYRALGIGRAAPEPCGAAVAAALLSGKRNAEFCWGELGAGTMMARTAELRQLGFDTKFRRGAEIDLAVRAALHGFHFISVAEPIIEQHVTSTTDKSFFKKCANRFRILYKHRIYLRQEGLLIRSGLRYFRYVLGLLGV